MAASKFHDRDIDRIQGPSQQSQHAAHEGASKNELFRGIPGYEHQGDHMLLTNDHLMPMNYNLFAMASEYFLVSLAALIGCFMVYWLGKYCIRRRGRRKQLKSMLSINERYKDLVEREETLQTDLVNTTEQLASVQFLSKTFIAVLLVGFLIAYRQGPSFIVYTAKEMPHLVITTPLVIVFALYLWTQRLSGRRESLIKEQSNLKPLMVEQEKLLRETIDPKLYDTFRRIILQDEQEKIERMRKHELGCTDKCRVKNSMLELDLMRNKQLVTALINFSWCDTCNNSASQANGDSPPSGAKTRLPQCSRGCGTRFVQLCKPPMEEYGRLEDKIRVLEAKYKKLDERDITFQQYREQQEAFKAAEVKFKFEQN